VSAAQEPHNHRTPSAVLFGVGALAAAAVCVIHAPFLLGIILAPAFIVVAVAGYLGKRWSTAAGAAVAALALLLALVSFGSIFDQPNAGMTVIAVLGSIAILAGAALGFLGTGLVLLGRRQAGNASSRSANSAPPWRNSSEAGLRDSRGAADGVFAAPCSGTSQFDSGQRPHPPTSVPDDNVKDDMSRVGQVATEGAYRLAKGSLSAWQMHRDRVADRRARAAKREAQAQSSGYIPPLRFSTQDMERRKRQKEDEEIRKARVAQARKYNRRN
jgi:hypothetical protein